MSPSSTGWPSRTCIHAVSSARLPCSHASAFTDASQRSNMGRRSVSWAGDMRVAYAPRTCSLDGVYWSLIFLSLPFLSTDNSVVSRLPFSHLNRPKEHFVPRVYLLLVDEVKGAVRLNIIAVIIPIRGTDSESGIPLYGRYRLRDEPLLHVLKSTT